MNDPAGATQLVGRPCGINASRAPGSRAPGSRAPGSRAAMPPRVDAQRRASSIVRTLPFPVRSPAEGHRWEYGPCDPIGYGLGFAVELVAVEPPFLARARPWCPTSPARAPGPCAGPRRVWLRRSSGTWRSDGGGCVCSTPFAAPLFRRAHARVMASGERGMAGLLARESQVTALTDRPRYRPASTAGHRDQRQPAARRQHWAGRGWPRDPPPRLTEFRGLWKIQ